MDKPKNEVYVTHKDKKKLWKDRKLAAEFYLQKIYNTEGEEKEQCCNIYTQIMLGKNECYDVVKKK